MCAAARGSIAIAFIGPLTGDVAARGLGGRNGAVLAVRQRNRSQPDLPAIELIVLDDACRPDQGIAVVQHAAANHAIVAAVAHYCSAVAARTAPLFESARLPAVLWGSHEADITDANDYRYVHRICGTNRLESDAAARFLIARGHRRWGRRLRRCRR